MHKKHLKDEVLFVVLFDVNSFVPPQVEESYL